MIKKIIRWFLILTMPLCFAWGAMFIFMYFMFNDVGHFNFTALLLCIASCAIFVIALKRRGDN